MNKISIFILFSISILFSFMGFANEVQTELNQKGQIILETIDLLESKGYITNKNALDAKKELVFSNQKLLQEVYKESSKSQSNNDSITVFEYFTIINVLKTLSVLAFLIFFRGFILSLIKGVPVVIYQSLLMTLSIFLTFYSQSIFGSHAVYISSFCVVANIILLGWIIVTHDAILALIDKLSLNFQPETVLFTYLTFYFGFFAIYFESSFIGILAVISFVSLFSFFTSNGRLSYTFGFEKEGLMNASIIINAIILSAYTFVTVKEIYVPYIEYFNIGIEYAISFSFVIGLLITASPFSTKEKMFSLSLMLMIASFVGFGIFGAFWFNMTVIPTFINTAFFLFVSSWVSYYAYKVSGILLAFIIGVALYSLAELIESFPHLFITSLF